jgi:membrane fusion protein (multidrug efflux system)
LAAVAESHDEKRIRSELRSIDPTTRSDKETTAVPATFTRTIRSLEADGSRSRVVDLLLLSALVAWVAWLIWGRVTLYEVSESARLEVEGAAHPIAVPLAGRVVETRMAIGRDVSEGDVLIVLDDRA